jgi:hypothetical protein
MRDGGDKTRTVIAPAGLSTEETIAWLGQHVISNLLKHLDTRRAARQKRYPVVVSSFLRRADLSVRFWDLLAGSRSTDEWRFIARHKGQWLPITLEIGSCAKHYEMAIANRAIRESIEAVPTADIRIDTAPGAHFGTLRFGTPEDEARQEEFIERRKAELLEQRLVEYMTPRAYVGFGMNARLHASPWACVTVYLETPEVTSAIVDAVSIAMGRKSELLNLSVIASAIKAVFQGNIDKIDSPAPPGYASWKDYVRMLYRANRLIMKSDSKARLLTYLQTELGEAA